MFIVSYPRSGHHLLEKLLYQIFTELGIEYSYCEYFNCCKSIPCKKGRIFQKIHHVEQLNKNALKNIEKQGKMIILYRENTIHQLEAFYRFVDGGKRGNFKSTMVKEKNREVVIYHKNTSLDYSDPVLFNELVDFIKERKEEHIDWKKHFINNNPCRNKVVIEYYEFVKSPLKFIEDILNLYNPKLKYDVNIINAIIEKNNVQLKNNLDEPTYNRLDNILREEKEQKEQKARKEKEQRDRKEKEQKARKEKEQKEQKAKELRERKVRKHRERWGVLFP